MASLLTSVLAFAVLLSSAASFVSSDGELSSSSTTALVVVDVQRCFCPNGTLPVPRGDEVVDAINNIRRKHEGILFDHVVRTKDWHPRDHVSFASSHPGEKVMDMLELSYDKSGSLCKAHAATDPPYAVECASREASLNQTMWPDHGIQGTKDAEFFPGQVTKSSDIIIEKGTLIQLDAYSAFFDNGHLHKTKLDASLKHLNVKTLFVVGLALDFCVKWTALDAASLGYDTTVVLDATRAIAQNTSQTISELKAAGVNIVHSL